MLYIIHYIEHIIYNGWDRSIAVGSVGSNYNLAF